MEDRLSYILKITKSQQWPCFNATEARTCGEDGYVHNSSPWISSRLFQRFPMEAFCFLHINNFHLLREAHLGVRLRQPDQRLQLPGVCGDHALATANLPHVHVCLKRRHSLHFHCILIPFQSPAPPTSYFTI